MAYEPRTGPARRENPLWIWIVIAIIVIVVAIAAIYFFIRPEEAVAPVVETEDTVDPVDVDEDEGAWAPGPRPFVIDGVRVAAI